MREPLRVTEVLRLAGLRDGMPFKSQEDREWYFQRGTMIHKACSLVDGNTLDWTTLDERIAPYVKGYKKFREEIPAEVLRTEFEIQGTGWVGHLDRLFRIGDLRVLCDIKTNECDIATAVQTAAYSRGIRGQVRRMGLALRDTEDYKITWYNEDAHDLACWQGALIVAQWKVYMGKKVDKEA
jgi:hypothetical protein